MRSTLVTLVCVIMIAIVGCGDSGPNSGSRCDAESIEDDAAECLDRCFGSCSGDECTALNDECSDRCNGRGEGLQCQSNGFCVPFP